ncbi:signal peptidase I [Pontibacillus litoralis]|uniref:Signal peptidase I n=1 Tax=Pontibacillus litoralis JSM 072002 TaxID=1385512 RepID=A0A0A5G807_9BACI|nr:signal peptidase I [Pontibacillus litoralis]KGX87308.1 signal peptidase [Pontibacillus litoralis JSM 072002]
MHKIVRNILILLTVIAIGYVLYNYEVVKVEGESMAPAMASGDYAIAQKSSENRQYHFNDIIVFEHDGKTLIKRVIATAGQEVEISDNKVYIDNVEFVGGECGDPCKNESYVLEDNEYFVMGDNITISTDSRYFGPIRKKNIRFEIVYYGF